MSPELLQKATEISDKIKGLSLDSSKIDYALHKCSSVRVKLDISGNDRPPTTLHISLSDIRSVLENKKNVLGEEIDALQKELESL